MTSKRACHLCWALGLLAAGCSGPLNDEIGLRGVEPLPGLSGVAPSDRPTGAPSICDLDRRHWPLVTILVPTEQVEHWPTYAHNVSLDRSIPRNRGEFPNAQSAVDVQSSWGNQVLEAPANIVVGLVLPVTALVEMVLGRWPGKLETSPAKEYELASPPREIDPWRWIEAAEAAPAQPQAATDPDDAAAREDAQ